MAGSGPQSGICVALHKRIDLGLPLGAEHRAGAIHHAPAWFQQWPQGIEQAPLDVSQGGHIGFAAQPAHIGMAAHDARCGAGRVQQDGIEGLAVPPGGGVGRIGHFHLGRAGGRTCRSISLFAAGPGCGHSLTRQPQALQVVGDALAAHGIHLQRQHIHRPAQLLRPFQQMSGFATGGGTGIQHPQTLAGCGVQPIQQKGGRQLGRRILHREPAVGITGQSLHRDVAGHHHTAGADRMRIASCLGQPVQIVIAADLSLVDAQHQRCRRLAGRQHRLPVLGMVAPHALDPPGRVVVAGLPVGIHLGHQIGLLAQKPAQAGVDHARLRSHAAHRTCSRHGLIDHGECVIAGLGRIVLPALHRRCRIGRQQQRQRRTQQRGHRCWRWLVGQHGQQRTRCTQVAQGMEGQRLHARAQRAGHLGQGRGQRPARLHRLHTAGHLHQLPGQRRPRILHGAQAAARLFSMATATRELGLRPRKSLM